MGRFGYKALELNSYTISSPNLPNNFSGYRIAHVSDFHNTELDKNNGKLLTLLRNAKPDMIAITGDLVDSHNTNLEIALQFAGEAAKIAPCYFVTGNHEASIPEYDDLWERLTKLGVIILENERVELERSGQTITLLGVNDPSFYTNDLFGASETDVMRHNLQELTHEVDRYTILLSHRPEQFDAYVEYDVDLVLSGHAHGGQFRLPFIGGLIAPNQGLFPKYDAGLYTDKMTTMVVSRGLGNSIIPFRLNNRPETILITLGREP